MSVNGSSGFLVRVFSLAFAIILSGAPYVHSVRAEPAPDVLPQAAADFINSGSATYSVDGSVGTVDQATNRASLNWDSFNIGSRATMNFVQPGTDSVTFNHIAQQDPSQIFGALNANGQIFLINQNGFIFGSESQVDVNSLVVSTLQMNDRIEQVGLQAPANARETAFALFGTGETGEIVIEDGAQISAQNGGRVFMFAPTVANQGEIRTPEGQAMLAAGESVYLTNDTDLRGFLVEVGVGGEVVNGSEANASATNGELIGKIIADKGSVTLAGLAVKQNGLVSANTGVNGNGQIRLQARDGGQIFGSGDPRLRASNSGTLTLGENSKTHANPDENETETALDSAEQLAGDILLYGDQIIFEDNSEVVAHGGNIRVQAQALPTDTPTLDRAGVVASNSLIQLGENVRIDASGLNIEKDIRSNLLTVDLRSDELKDVPLQRNGVLKDSTVVVDIRQHGTREDGSVWEGTPVADISDRISTIGRTVAERSLAGGSVTLQSQGAVVVDESAVVDVSGGSITFTEGRLNTTLLQSANGPSVEISQADPNVVYDGIVNRAANDVEIQITPGYIEGKDAGSIQVNAFQSYLHGSFKGDVVTGIYQQNVAKSLATITDFNTEIARLYRPFDEAPSGGELILGQPIGAGESIFRYDEVSFVNQLSALPDVATIDPASDPNRVEVGENILQGFEHIKAFAAEGVIEEGVVLDVGPGGSAEFEFRNFDMRGAIVAPAGNVSIRNPDGNEVSPGFGDGLYTFGDTAKIDVSGRWFNQSRAFSRFENPIAIDAGSIRVDVGGGVLNIAENASFDASAGALLRTGSKLDIGNAGSITISAESFDQPLQLGNNFFAYGINGSSGGELDITVTGGACVGGTACADTNAQRIDPAYLTAGGFSKKKLTFTTGGVDIQAGTQINLQSRTRELDVLQALNAVSGTSIESISSVVTPAQIANRSAVDLSLVAAGDVILNDGAQILADPGAEISLFSDSSIYVGGDIVALGGTVDLELGNGNLKDLAPDLVDAYDATQTIWLGEDSSIDVSGTTVFDPANRNGLVRGKVFDGGTVNIEAKRGFVFIDQGARVNADAVSAGFAERIGSNFTITPYLVAGDGGTVNVFTADGYVNRGDVSARAAIPGVSRAGTFNLTIDAGARGALARQEASGFPGGDRVVVLTPDQSRYLSEDLSFGDALPDSLVGKAIIDQAQIADGRFDNLTVRANAYSQRRLVAGLPVDEFYQGVVEFDDGLDLQVGRLFSAEAPLFRALGDSQIRGAIARLANAQIPVAEDPGPAFAEGQDTQLSFEFDLVDVVGDVTFDNAATLRLESHGDLRFVGIPKVDGQLIAYEGSLTTQDANIELVAQQMYPTTLTQFEINNLGSADNNQIVTAYPSTPLPKTDVLTVGGKLTFNAQNIVHGGAIVAPLTEVELNARDSISFEDGSVISLTADGLLIPFGQVELGSDWVYSFPNSTRKAVFGADENDQIFPGKRLFIGADRVEIKDGSTINLSGGGDLFAYEFVPGVNGSEDVLSVENAGDSFAVVPGLDLDYAPIDPEISNGSALEYGESVTLAGGGGLAAGTYLKLPARYALLPGAFLVTPVNNQVEVAVGNDSITQPDGGVIVSGNTAYANSTIVGGQPGAFLVQGQDTVNNLALYQRYNLTDFGAVESGSGRLPNDSGVLSIATNALDLNGTLIGTPAENGEGVALDIASKRIAVVNDQTDRTVFGDDFLFLDQGQLSDFGAQSILLGATREDRGEEVEINFLADSEGSGTEVMVSDDVELNLSEVLFAATDRVDIGNNVTITTTGNGQTVGQKELLYDGRGVVVVNSGVNTWRARFDSSQNTDAILNVGNAVQFNADQSVLVATPQQSDLSSLQASVLNGVFSLVAPSIELTQGVASNIVAQELSYIARDEIVVTEDTSFTDFERFSLSTPKIRAQAAVAETADLTITAQTFALSGATESVGALTDSSVGQPSTMQVNAEQFLLQDGVAQIEGFGEVGLNGSEQIIVRADGALQTDGNLSLVTDQFTATSGVDYRISSLGDLSLDRATTQIVDTQTVANLGSLIELRASGNVTINSLVDLNSGVFQVTSETGDVEFLESANIDIGGVDMVFDDRILSSHGGYLYAAAQSGNILFAEGSTVNLDGGALAGNSGRFEAIAPEGMITLDGAISSQPGQLAGDGGQFRVDARRVNTGAVVLSDAFRELNRQLNDSGFTGLQEWRLREGDLVHASDELIRADEVRLIVDQGSLEVAGTIDARNEEGGQIELYAADNVVLSSTGRLIASKLGSEGYDQSRVVVSSSAGNVDLRGGSQIVLGVEEGGVVTAPIGEILIRAPRTATDVNVTAIDSDVVGAERISVEAVGVTSVADGRIDGALVNSIRDAANAFAVNVDAIEARLSRAELPDVVALVGEELVSSEDFIIDTDIDTSSWRFGTDQTPGVLTFRTEGNLYIGDPATGASMPGRISDGFDSSGNYLTDESWSFRLVAGADASSSQVNATQYLWKLPADRGDLVIKEGQAETVIPFFNTAPVWRGVRTGTGFIDVAVARDLVLQSPQSVIYTAGRIDANGNGGFKLSNLGELDYAQDGGDIRIRAGRDIVAENNTRLFTDWWWHNGGGDAADVTGNFITESAAWTVNPDWFAHGVAALAGGNVSVESGRDINELSAWIPSIGKQVGGQAIEDGQVEITGGGLLEINAGGDIRGGQYLVGRGEGSINARGSIVEGATLKPVVYLQDSNFVVESRRDLQLETVINPTTLPVSPVQTALLFGFPFPASQSTYFTYGRDASIDLRATAGEIVIGKEVGIEEIYDLEFNQAGGAGREFVLSTYPGIVSAQSLSGNIRFEENNSITLFPSVVGNLELFAGNSITIPRVTRILLSGTDPSVVPDELTPVVALSQDVVDALNPSLIDADSVLANPSVALHGRTLEDGRVSNQNSKVVAKNGSITFGTTNSFIRSAKPLDLVAGQDLINPSVVVQHNRVADVSQIKVGGELDYPLQRGLNGSFVTVESSGIFVDGPGRLDVVTGGSINLGTSAGIVARGNTVNPNLPSEQSATVNVLPGVKSLDTGVQSFFNQFIAGNADNIIALLADFADLGEVAVENFGGQITDPSDLSQFGIANENRYAPFVGQSPENLQLLYALGKNADIVDRYVAGETDAGSLISALSLQGADVANEADLLTQIENAFISLRPQEQFGLAQEIFFAELLASATAQQDTYSRAFDAIDAFFPADDINPADVSLFFSRIASIGDGDINLFVPGGSADVGVANANVGPQKSPEQLGLQAQGTGSLRAFLDGNFNVNESRALTADGGDIFIFSRSGDIDAGRGSKGAVSSPETIVNFDAFGNVVIDQRPALAGSGIRAFVTSEERTPGNVFLFAPNGRIIAGDAGIGSAGNLTVAALDVIGTDNIDVGGVSVGVPQVTVAAPSVSVPDVVASNATDSAEEEEESEGASAAEEAATFLDVFVVGLGTDSSVGEAIVCDNNDPNIVDCTTNL